MKSFDARSKKNMVGQRTQKQDGTQHLFLNKNARVFPHHCVGFWIFAGNPHPPPFSPSSSSSSSSRRPPSSSLTSQPSLSISLYHTHLYQPVSMINFSPSTCLYHFHLYQLLSDHTPLYQLASIPRYLSGGRRGTWWPIWALGHRELGWRGCFWDAAAALHGRRGDPLWALGRPGCFAWHPSLPFAWQGLSGHWNAVPGRWWPTVDCLCKSCPV